MRFARFAGSRWMLGVGSAVMLVACGGSEPSGAAVDDDPTGTSGSGGTSGASGTSGGLSGRPPLPSDTDGIKNGDETDVDCGGSTSRACAEGSGCAGSGDCASKVCTGTTCQAPAPNDGQQNGDETGVDCGGSVASPCADGVSCASYTDCINKICEGNLCLSPSANDGQQNGDETGVDCGGSVASPCADQLGCALARDCQSKVCTAQICQAPLPNDGQQNGDETDVDCGGAVAPACNAAQRCVLARDCDSRFCTGLVCEPRMPGRKDGDETDIDCGGSISPACDWDKSCALDADCTSGACVGSVCQTGPSCRQRYGASTCGAGEDPPRDGVAANHQSCCRSLPVTGYADPRPAFAGKTVYLDKYEITAGRMREFLRVIGGAGEPNVRAYMAAHRPARWNNRWEEVLPTSNYAGSTLNYTISNPTLAADVTHYPGQDIFGPTSSQGTSWFVTSGNYTLSQGVYRALGAPHFFPEFRANVPQWDFPDYSASHAMNCGNQTKSFGLSTYYFPPEIVSNPLYSNGVAKAFTQNQMDQKSLNCSPTALMAAMCAWDGGQLATSEVIDYVTTGRLLYAGADCTGSGNVPLNVSNDGTTACYGVYYYPFGGSNADDSGRIAPPGRVPGDTVRLSAGTEPWHDLNGNLAEVTLQADGTFARRGWGLGWGSVASHHGLQISLPRFKGSAFGARCMRFK